MILSSHYVIKDILHTVECGDAGEIRKVCEKYCDRYRNDEGLAAVCSLISVEDSGQLSDKRLSEIRTRLQDLLSVRRLDVSGGTNLWFVDRRKIK
jgi:hypothetical protein